MAVEINGTTGVSLVQDGVVQTADLADGAVTAAKINSAVALGITEVDMYRLNASSTITSSTFLESNWERVDTNNFEKIGTGMGESSGVFTFPSTGYWIIRFTVNGYNATANPYWSAGIRLSVDSGSSYGNVSNPYQGHPAGHDGSVTSEAVMKITNTSTQLVKFQVSTAGTVTISSSTGTNQTYASFIKVADV